MTRLIIAGVVALGLLLPQAAHAQVVRETDTASLARVLDGDYDEFTFVNNRPAILFVDLDADIYQVHGRPGEDHHTEASAEEPGGCSDEGGPGGFCLQVFDSDGELLCWADRPMRPGWQRDPRLACPLFNDRPEVMTLRVSARGEGENPCELTSGYPSADELGIGRRVYLLTASLRRIVAEGRLAPALAQSYNGL